MSDQLNRLKTSLADRYAIQRVLGRGGMATVYLATDLRHDRAVALKVLKPELAAVLGPDRFLQEIKTTARLNHPHILPLLDSGDVDGMLFYVMPYVEGETLRDRLAREKLLPVEDALQIAREVADGLGHAHASGIVHRDVKPENILLSGGHAVIADFGVAVAVREAGGERLTETGLVLGTPAYMSPEQASGDTTIDARSDVYALACVLYEMMGGEPPHTGPTPGAILARQLTGDVRSLQPIRSSVSVELDTAIRRALAPTPADRYRTMAEFASVLTEGVGMPAAPHRPRYARRTAVVVGAAAVLAAGYWGVTRGGGLATPADDRLGVAVFPFRATDRDATQWSEQVPDLLSTVLDGTPAIRVADPWTLWRGLRAEPGALATSPADAVEAAALAGRAAADRFVLGSVTDDGGTVRLNVRLYRAGIAEPLRAFLFDGPADSLASLVQRVAVAIIGEVFPSRVPAEVTGVARYGTQSADALKAYLRAREAMRRGQVDEAEAAIDQALAVDSTFALALVEATSIKSWAMFMRGDFFTGLMELAERAVRHGDSLSERNRLKARAMLASVRTDGVAAAEAASRIIEIDSTAFDAWHSLAYYHLVYGWQYGADEYDALGAAERAVQLDSTYIPGLLRRAHLSVVLDNPEDIRRQIARLRAVEHAGSVVRGTLFALRAILASDSAFPSLADTIATLPFSEWLATHRHLRSQQPSRAELLLDRLNRMAGPGRPQQAVLGEIARLKIAEGRLAEVDREIVAGKHDADERYKNLNRFLVAASLAGVGYAPASERAVNWLAAYVPPDSALHYSETRPVWWTLWLVGAYHAEFGDTTIARRSRQAIGTLPAGGTPLDYRGGLQSDLDARLASRRGDLATALAKAGEAIRLWSIHSDNDWEALAAPAMRFHLGMLLSATGRPDSAAALLRSLVPPGTWMGFLTARASYELGQLAERRGEFANAARYYLSALRLWERGGPEIASWRESAREALSRAVERRG